MIKHKRYFSAIDVTVYMLDDIPSEIIVEMLEKAVTEQASDEPRFKQYEIGELFTTLDKRNDTELQVLIKLEWYYLSLLSSYGNSRTPKLLHNELANNPDFFIEVFKFIYKSKAEEENLNKEAESNKLDEQAQYKVRTAFDLLYSWRQIPGVDEKMNINEEFLIEWISKVRAFAEGYGKINNADAYIGQILAQYPKSEDNWPPDAICKIIESINSDSINRNFSAAVVNSRGVTTRGVFDGGGQEVVLADYYHKLFEQYKNKFPVVASILNDLSNRYREDAKQEDDRAERDKLDY